MMYRMAFLLFVLAGCQIDQPFDYESEEDDLIVMASLLTPDSTISIELSRAINYPEGNKQIISNALVTIYENNELLGEATFDPDVSKYHFPATPKPGAAYKIIAEVADRLPVYAETTIPSASEISACFRLLDVDGSDPNGKIKADITYKGTNALWLGALSDYFYFTPDIFPLEYDSSRVMRKVFKTLYSNSSLADDFNLYQDGGLSSYDYYLRVPALLLNPESPVTVDMFSFETDYWYRTTTLNSLSDSLGLYIIAMTGSEEFDSYMKSSIINVLNSNVQDGLFNPFVEQVIPFSNVQNGSGVVAGYTLNVMPLHESPCN